MQPSERSAQARREIDRRFSQVDLTAVKSRPKSGWIRAIRGALAMSQQALGMRLGISRASIAKLEQAELVGGITIAKLTEVARALDCTLVYALVPNISLEDTIQRQARQIVTEQLSYAATSMALEDQDIDAERRDEYLTNQIREIIRQNRIWSKR